MDVKYCPNCMRNDIRTDPVNGKLICGWCGVVVGEMVLTEEVGFGETSSGAVVADGTRLSSGALGVAFGKQGRYGGTSQELTESAGKRRCVDLANGMGLGYGLGEEASRIWYMAYHARFTRGRRGDLVVAACIYLASRKKDEPYMLIDFSSQLSNVNVFELGAVYLKLLKVVPLKDNKPLDPAIYIHRFANLLDFGDDIDKVKMDAANLVKGFKRDWMVEGRRPSGICGAALILAARMNNYRRSVAEIVQVVKIADSTLKKRLEEFQQTPTGQMSITEVRQKWELDKRGIEAFPSSQAPPIFNKHRRVEALQAEESARAARRASSEAGSGAGEGDEDEDHESGSRRKKRKLNQNKDIKQVKRDREGSAAPSSRAGTPRIGTPVWQTNSEAGPGPTTQANALNANGHGEQDGQADLEDDDDDVLNSAVADQIVGDDLNEAIANEEVAEALTKIEHMKQEELHHIKEDIASRPEDDPLKGLDEDELDDYICDPIEAKIKMHTWIDTNMDYLIKLQAKLRKNKLDELRDEAEAEQKKPKMRRGPVGPAESAAEATKGLIERRQYSRNVNYKAIDSLFESHPDSEDGSRAGTPLRGMDDEQTDEKGDDGDEDHEKTDDHGNDKADDCEEEDEEPSYRHQSHVDHEQWD